MAFVAGLAARAGVLAVARAGRGRRSRHLCGARRARRVRHRGAQPARAVVNARPLAGPQQLHQLEHGQQQHVDKRDPSAGVDDFLGYAWIWPYCFRWFAGTRHQGVQLVLLGATSAQYAQSATPVVQQRVHENDAPVHDEDAHHSAHRLRSRVH